MTLSPVIRENLTGRAYDQLRAALMEGHFWPGQRLKISELATALLVSETPIREAVMQLARERGLEIEPNRAVTVATLSLAQYLELRRIRLELEGLAAAAAAAHVREVDIAELTRVHAALMTAEAQADYPGAVRANWHFHHLLYRIAAMPELLGIIETIWLRNGPLLNYQYPHAPPTYAGRHRHLDVIDALRARDAAAIRAGIVADTVEGGARLLALLTDIDAGRVTAPLPKHAFGTRQRGDHNTAE